MQTGSVYCEKRNCRFVSGGLDKKASAIGAFNDSLLTTGWGILDINAGYGSTQGNDDVMFAAGFLEGVFTYRYFRKHYLYSLLCPL